MIDDTFGGIDPPSHSLIPPDPLSIPRECIKCGKIHDTGWQNMLTGEMIERVDKCKNCFMNDWFYKCKEHWDTAEIDIKFIFNKIRKDEI